MDVHGLHGRTAGALAQVVDAGHQHALIVVAQHEQVGAIGAVAALHIEKAARYGFVQCQRLHRHERLARIAGRQGSMNGGAVDGGLVPPRGSPNGGQVQRHRYGQSLVPRPHHRHEQRCPVQRAVALHFGQVLVRQPQCIGARRQHRCCPITGQSAAGRYRAHARCIVRRAGQRGPRRQSGQRLAILGDHLLAPARITGVRGGRHWPVGRQQAGVHQRPHRQNEGRGMAARIGNALAAADACALFRRQLRQPIGPGRIHPVCRAGIDHAGGRIADQRHRLARRGIRQAQKGHVGRVQQPRPLGRILAQRRVDPQHRHIRSPAQILMNL